MAEPKKEKKVEVKEEKPAKTPKEKNFGENPYVLISKKGKEVVKAMEIANVGCIVDTNGNCVFAPGTRIFEKMSPMNNKKQTKVVGRKIVSINYKGK